jgi:predicted nucleic acid-binding Zn ribbon protein
MPEDKDKEDEQLSEGAKQLYRKTRVPHKFCPYCGHRNEADAQECANCGKDISWMRVPEPVPYEEPPMQKPRSMPEQTKVFTPKAVIVFVLIILVILTLILVLVLTTTKSKKGKAFEIKVAPACAFLTPQCASAASFVTPPPPGSA